MAKRKLTEQASETTAAPINPEPAKSELPQIESPLDLAGGNCARR